MELAMRFGATAGVALAAAGLITVTSVARPSIDELQERAVQLTGLADLGSASVDVASAIDYSAIDAGLVEIDSGVTAIVGGDTGDGISDIVAGANAILAALGLPPLDLVTSLTDAVAKQPFDSTFNTPLAPPSVDAAELSTALQNGEFTIGLGYLFQDFLHEGAFNATLGLSDAFIHVPQDLFFGTASALLGAW